MAAQVPFVVQPAAANQVASSASIQSNSLGTVANGDAVLVAVEMEATGAGTFTVTFTDTVGTNTYTQLGSYVNVDANRRLAVFIALNVNGGATFKVTATPSSSAKLAIAVMDLAGVYLASAQDGTSNATGTSTSPAGGSTTVTNSYELAIAVCTSAAAGTITCAVPTGYILGPQILTGTSNPVISMAYAVLASGTTNPAWTLGSSANWAAINVTLLSQVMPNIQFYASAGTDGNSGAGPGDGINSGTLKTGTHAGTVGTNVVTVTGPAGDNVDLSGILTNGSMVLCVQGTSTRVMSRIIGVSGGPAGSNWTITCQDVFSATESGKTWTIGGKAGSINATYGKTLWTANGARGGWTATVNEDESLSAVVTRGAAGDVINGPITLQGSVEGRVISCSVNAAIFSGTVSSNYWQFVNLAGKCTAGTKSSSAFIAMAGSENLTLLRVRCNDATSWFQNAIQAANSGTTIIEDCNFANLGGDAIQIRGTVYLTNVVISDCPSGAGIKPQGSASLYLYRTVIARCLNGISDASGPTTIAYMSDCTIDRNTNYGLFIAGTSTSTVPGLVINNQITNNGTAGFFSNPAKLFGVSTSIIDGNNYYGNGQDLATWMTKGPNDTALDPQYVDAASAGHNNWWVGNTALLGKALPVSSRTIGGNSATTSYAYQGAAQVNNFIAPSARIFGRGSQL